MDTQAKILQSLKLTAIGDPFSLQIINAGTAKGEHPFIGLITYAGKSSDNCVGGTEILEGGPYRVFIPTDLMRRKITELEGCSVFAENNLDSHSKTKPVGEFVSAWCEPADTPDGRMVLAARASGLLSHNKNPEMVDKIVAEARNKKLGFSYDIKDIYFTLEAHEVFPDLKVVKIIDFQWRGATILYNDVAAYGLTQLAAREKENLSKVSLERIKEAVTLSINNVFKNKTHEVNIMNETELKQMTDAIASAVDTAVKPIKDEVAKVSEEIKTLKTETSELKAKAEAKKPEAKAETKPEEKSIGTVDDLVKGIGDQFTAAIKPLTEKLDEVIKANKPEEKKVEKAPEVKAEAKPEANAEAKAEDKKPEGNVRKTAGAEGLEFMARYLPEDSKENSEEVTIESLKAASKKIAEDTSITEAQRDRMIGRVLQMRLALERAARK